MRRTGTAWAAALTLSVVTGCGPSDVAEPAPALTETAADPGIASAEASKAPPTQAAPMTVPCAPANGTASDLQLTEVTLLDTGTALQFTWTTNQDPPGTVAYLANVGDDSPVGENGLAYELAVEFRDGTLHYFGVFEPETSEITQIPGDDLDGSWPSRTFTATFPYSAIPGVEGAFDWTAGLSLEVGGGGRGIVSECRVDGAPVAYP